MYDFLKLVVLYLFNII